MFLANWSSWGSLPNWCSRCSCKTGPVDVHCQTGPVGVPCKNGVAVMVVVDVPCRLVQFMFIAKLL